MLDENDERSGVMSAVLKEFDGLKAQFKSEDNEASPFEGLQKSTVLQEAKCFNDHDFVMSKPNKCCKLITKLLYILTCTGETFSDTEASDVFFSVTKLFESKDMNLRRMVYLFIKEVSEATAAEEVIIVVQSLMKDMNSSEDLYRANSIRVLGKIIDAPTLSQIDRYIKQALVDRNNFTSSSALISGLHLFKIAPDVVRRWVNEVQEACSSSSPMVQYHALALMHHIKSHDRLALGKLVQTLSRGSSVRSPLATCLLIRFTTNLLKEDMAATNTQNAYEFLESCMRHKSEMVMFEAARAVCNLPNVTSRELGPAITVLQMFLGSAKPTLRFASVRTLNMVAKNHPLIVVKCCDEMEGLISDTNRSIATLATTTLLKIGSESSIDRLMKQISSFISEIADEFKIEVVKAIHTLCLKYPAKYLNLLKFLSSILRDEGGYDFKLSVVNTIIDVMKKVKECRETALFHLCEFIEDCEFTVLSVQILHLLGEEGPSTSDPQKYIRFIFNRVILENSAIRAAAVSSMTKFAVKVAQLRPSIIELLKRSLVDDDDEVRDRAMVSIQLLRDDDSRAVNSIMNEHLPMSWNALEKSLRAYQLRPADGALSLVSLPHVEEDKPTASSSHASNSSSSGDGDGGGFSSNSSMDDLSSSVATKTTSQDYAETLYKIPEFAMLGALFRSSVSVPLTESESEYRVTCVKHIFSEHVVFQFNFMNTLDDVILENVYVEMEGDDNGYEVKFVIPTPTLECNVTGSSYVCMKRDPEMGFPSINFTCNMKFDLKEVADGIVDETGYPEEYPIEDIDIGASDFMARIGVRDFRSSWELIGDSSDVMETFALSFKSVEDGVKGLIQYVGMQPHEETGTVTAGSKQHQILLCGVFIGGVKVLARGQVGMTAEHGCVLKLHIRSEDEFVSQTVSECIQ